MLYPDFIYEQNSGLQFFFTGITETAYSTSSSIKEGTRSATGDLFSISTPKLPTESLKCIVTGYYVDEIERVFNYLRGKTVILGIGTRKRASYAKIVSANVNTSPGDETAKSVSIEVQHLGRTSGYVYGVNFPACGTTGVLEKDLAAVNEITAKIWGLWNLVQFKFTKNFLIPNGEYTMFCRARDTTHVPRDLLLAIRDENTNTVITSYQKTVVESYGFYFVDVTLSGAQEGHTLYVQAVKSINSPNSLCVDLIGLLAKP